MVCTCALSSNCVWLSVWLQVIFCLWINETTRDTFSREKRHIASLSEDILKNKPGDRMIKQLVNSVTTKYRDLPVSRTSIICLSLRLRQIIDLLATDKSRYFAQPRPIIVKYRANAIHQFCCCCFVFCLYVSYHSSCRKEQHFTVLALKFPL